MLFLVGLGLGDVKDITVKGLEVVKKADHVYLEAYTSILCGQDKESLEVFYGREVKVADREFVENEADVMLNAAQDEDVALLVVGDPFGATTHSDLVLRAIEKGIQVKTVHNASILNAVGCCGLQLYSFGETVSIPLWEEGWRPVSFFDKIINNRRNGFHSLCLLDIKVKEKSLDALMKGKVIYQPPRFMGADEAAKQLLAIVGSKKEETDLSQEEQFLLNEDTLCVALARIGSDEQLIKCCSLQEMSSVDMGRPLHSLIIPGKLHPLEAEMLGLFTNKKA